MRSVGGRQTGKGGGNRSDGGTARSRRLAGTAASEFPGRRGGGGGVGPNAKFEPVRNSSVVTVSTAALFSPRAEPGPGPAGGKLSGLPGPSLARSRYPPALRRAR